MTSALAGPLVNARATSAGVAPCAPIPGSRRMDLRQQLSGLAHGARIRRADDGADAREAALADDVLAELGDELRDVLPDLVAVRQRAGPGRRCRRDSTS